MRAAQAHQQFGALNSFRVAYVTRREHDFATTAVLFPRAEGLFQRQPNEPLIGQTRATGGPFKPSFGLSGAVRLGARCFPPLVYHARARPRRSSLGRAGMDHLNARERLLSRTLRADGRSA